LEKNYTNSTVSCIILVAHEIHIKESKFINVKII